MLKLTKYKVKGFLPNPFIFNSGNRVKDKKEWEIRKLELYDYAINLQFGGMPPEPEFLEVEHLNKGKNQSTYKIYTGTRENPISFVFKFIKPISKNRPVIIDGDMCGEYFTKEGFLNCVLNNDIGFILFDRTELASDIGINQKQGQIYRTYKNGQFGVLSAWAWGYLRCIDAIYKLNLEEIDLNCITVTGHSRGGKATLIAGAVDNRIAIVNPNEACLCGGGCYRIEMEAKYNETNLWRSETLKDIWNENSSWIGNKMKNFIDKEESLPFDTHFLKALVAPRVLLVTEAVGDIWANPIGSWMTTIATKEIYKFLDNEENIYWSFREGMHYHKTEDMEKLVDIIKHIKDGEKLTKEYFLLPFDEPEIIFDWKYIK